MRILAPAAWQAIYLGVAAATLPCVLPVMIGVLADDLKFGTVQAGYVASANLGGVALGSVVCAALVGRYSWQTLIRAGAATMIGTNLLTMAIASFPLFAAMRFLSGLGEGVIAAICYAAMGRSGHSARALAFYAAGQGLVGALGMGLIPGIVSRAGWPWLFIIVSVVVLPTFWFARGIETLRGVETSRATMPGRLTWLPRAALVCILVYFIGMSAVWSLTERMGRAKGIELDHLSIALSSSAIANMTGSLLIGFFAHRIGTLAGLSAGLALALAGLLMLVKGVDWQAYLIAVSLFFLAWGVYFPFLFRTLAGADRSGRMAILLPLVTGAAFTLGPALGAHLLTAGGALLLCAFGAACIVASGSATALIHVQSRKGAAP
jgi:predicted MFS family arabinose efflux permease